MPVARTKRGGRMAKAKSRPKAKSTKSKPAKAKSAKTKLTPKRKSTQAATRAAGRVRSSGRAGARGSGKGTVGKSGEGLDGGVARRQAGDPGAVGTRPTARHRPSPR